MSPAQLTSVSALSAEASSYKVPVGPQHNPQMVPQSCMALILLVGQWAGSSSTAMLGQPLTRPEQAPAPHPLSKISLIPKGAHGSHIRY